MLNRFVKRGEQIQNKEEDMKCVCGFKFAGAGEFRNCDAFINDKGESGVICPKCGKAYVNGKEVIIPKHNKKDKLRK